jgi:hypothetical protein
VFRDPSWEIVSEALPCHSNSLELQCAVGHLSIRDRISWILDRVLVLLHYRPAQHEHLDAESLPSLLLRHTAGPVKYHDA